VQAAGGSYPATFSCEPAGRVANWRAIGNPILAIPHLVVVQVLGYVSSVVALISWFAIVFTGRMPEGLANFQAMYMRYEVRAYVFAGFLREEYPPFAFATMPADPGDDARVRVDFRPQLENRNRVTTGFRLILAIPHLVVLAVLGIAAWVVVVIAFFAVLFTGQWPTGMRDFVLGVGRWSVRVGAYTLLLTDEYPPFSLD